MKRRIYSVFVLCSVFAISCTNETGADTQTAGSSSVPVTAAVVDSAVSNSTDSNISAGSITQPAKLNFGVADPSVPLNPEHGKPGHRCDIAVGAPLNSTPTTSPVQTAAPTNNSATNATTTAPVATNKTAPANGLNPKHGEPGHRCELAVGAPLNSAPVSKTIPASSSPTQSPALPVTYSNPLIAPPANKTAAPANGLNPKHGEPGHRCDIAVGAPLNSAPATPTVIKDSAKSN